MKPTEDLLKMKGNKNITTIAIINRIEGRERVKCIRFFLNFTLPSGQIVSDYISFPIDMTFEDFTNGDKPKDSDKLNIFFCQTIYHFNDCHFKTFLSKLKKDVDFHFKVRINNNQDNFEAINFVRHELFGVINVNTNKDDIFYLQCYVGENNSASPVIC
jgi:hypothetical protein